MPYGKACELHSSLRHGKPAAGKLITIGIDVVPIKQGYSVRAVNEDGVSYPNGEILKLITETGTVLRTPGLNPKLGFKLSPAGCIAVSCHRDSHPATIQFLDAPVFLTSQGAGDERFALAIDDYKGSRRLVAVNVARNARVKDGNLLKFKVDGTLYSYHTINKVLGARTNQDGMLLVD